MTFSSPFDLGMRRTSKNGGRFGGNRGVLYPPFEVEHPEMLEVFLLHICFLNSPLGACKRSGTMHNGGGDAHSDRNLIGTAMICGTFIDATWMVVRSWDKNS